MWVLIALAGLLALIVLLLSVPTDLAFSLEVYGRPKFRARFSWFFGLLSRDIKGRKKKDAALKKAVKKKAGKKKRGGGRKALRLLSTRGLIRRLKALILGILRRLEFREFRMDFRGGLENPADSAIVFSLIWPAYLFLGPSFGRHVNLQVSFEGVAFLEGYCQGAVRLRPIRLSPPLARFIFSVPTLRAIKRMVIS
ncbi:MAG: hypothetical protein ABUK03_02680 [Dehalococcoidales bacterium]